MVQALRQDVRVAEDKILARNLPSRGSWKASRQINRATPVGAGDPLDGGRAVGLANLKWIWVGDDAVQPTQAGRAAWHVSRQSEGRERIGRDWRWVILDRFGADLVSIHEQNNAIGEHRTELREARVALRRRWVGWHGAAGERLEPHQHPQRIVGDLEYEALVAGEGEHDPRTLSLVRERCLRRQEHHGEREQGETAMGLT